MTKEIKALLDNINAKKAEIKELCAANKIEEAKKAKEELIALNDKFNLMVDLDDGEPEGKTLQEGKKAVEGQPKDKKKSTVKAFLNIFKAQARGNPVSYEDISIVNAASSAPIGEDGLSDGGVTIPEDIRTSINELRRTSDNLEQYINVEPTSLPSGSRVIETSADITPFDEIDEEDNFDDVNTPKLKTVKYKIKKFGGILKATAELLADSAENILGWLQKYIAKKVTVTRNSKIIAALDDMTDGNTVEITSLDKFKDVINEELDPALLDGTSILTNQTGFNILDKIKDKDGNYVLQKDPTNATKKLLFGEYPIIKVSKKTLKNDTDGNAPCYIGNLKDALTLFDREHMTIDVSSVAGTLWATDKTGVKVRDRFDVQPVDTEAVFKGFISKSLTTTVPVSEEATDPREEEQEEGQ